ncbi:hypothetical protein PR202_ga08108 [Eleusine coracana subsp. coracana]|uniref:Uncharacterized protein n=1 Tax=Eleusine coracana subsp. coracana TaxID=191504 RepID=A0AAV5C2B7_ELECO|nr:hypothetical protein PR202_ga08108 [Eleusine coracana subsp. coracana]
MPGAGAASGLPPPRSERPDPLRPTSRWPDLRSRRADLGDKSREEAETIGTRGEVEAVDVRGEDRCRSWGGPRVCARGGWDRCLRVWKKRKSKAEEWGGVAVVVQEGDVVEAVRVGRSARDRARAALELEAPFKGGRAGLHKTLHVMFKHEDTCVEVRMRGSRELQAYIMLHHAAPGGGRKQYVPRSMHDPNYLLGFIDRLQSECQEFQVIVVCGL